MPSILKVLEKENGLDDVQQKALSMLKAWDLSMDAKSGAAAIFETFYLHLIKCIFSDELGDLFENYNAIPSVSRGALDQILHKSSPWFDDISTRDRIENLDDDIGCAFRSSVSELQDKMGRDPASWEWGKIHYLKLTHPLASVKVLDRIFNLNRGPFPAGGSFHTVSTFGYDANKPFAVTHGSSHRHIFDSGNWDRSLTVIPTGTSGIPASKHYCDQTELYMKGLYHADYFSKEKIIAHARYHMKFYIK
jgi:penicillin amidase